MSSYANLMSHLDERAREEVRRVAVQRATERFWAALNPLLMHLSRTEQDMVIDALEPGLECLQQIVADDAEDKWKRDE